MTVQRSEKHEALVVDGTALWFGAAGFEVLDVVDDGVELVIEVETSTALVGCSECGTKAVPKDRRWVTLRDVPAGRRFVRVRWRKRVGLLQALGWAVRVESKQHGATSDAPAQPRLSLRRASRH